jgi:hypothetical protein
MVPHEMARQNIGQPLAAYVEKARQLGYRLICYLDVNAFFLANDVGAEGDLPTVETEDAWVRAMELSKQSAAKAEYLYMRNRGMIYSLYQFNNPIFTADYLGIQPEREELLARRGRKWRRKVMLRKILRPWRT